MSKPFCCGVPFDSLSHGDDLVVEVNGEPVEGCFHAFEVIHDQWCMVLRPVECCTKFWREWHVPTCDITAVLRPKQSQPFKPADLHVGRVVLERCFRGDERTVR